MPRFLVVLDVDSTLIEDEAIELLAAEAGSLDRVADVTARAMNGELDFASSLRERVATLAGLSTDVFARVGERIRLTDGVPELIAGVQGAGGAVAVVSGGFHELLDPLASRLGLDRWEANRLETAGDVLTGRVDGPVVDARAKATAVDRWRAELGATTVVAIGDGANDLLMMERAELSIAFDAKAPVRERADLVLDERDLSRVLPLLGL
ncbi:phosphoserine phosphatase [Diaminobutyricimonas aerilata]|uniref:phosphoserine phosphatase n=1 Tax=Diaminobutyricimonas aerilata TaxID=1162967 RepID=A0A2M9CJY7_9MICO|nr:phosphoserine phosphatase SerB [Diaminobutyricimonas aerilata]PJJ72199.1 phosphoserine phosphatase [Diaminobutyricimonas aerilata]